MVGLGTAHLWWEKYVLKVCVGRNTRGSGEDAFRLALRGPAPRILSWPDSASLSGKSPFSLSSTVILHAYMRGDAFSSYQLEAWL